LERGMLEIAIREIESDNTRTKNYVTETYEVKYVSATDLARLVKQQLPNIRIQAGPAPKFIANARGGSSAFSGGGGQSGGGGGQSGGGGGQSGGSGQSGGQSGSQNGQSGQRDESRVLLVTGTPDDVARAKVTLGKLDLRPIQLVFKAEVVDVNRSDALNLGIRYDLSSPISIGEQNPGDSVGKIAPSGDNGRPIPFGSISRTPYGIKANIDALEKRGKAKTIASPTLRALDGQSAVSFIGQEIKYVASIQQAQTGANVATEKVQVGITLSVTGKSNGDGTITLYVHPEVSSISSFLTQNGVSLPQIATRYADTQIRVKDGEQVVIGGLIQKEEFDNVQAVPYLSKLPIIGQLFRTSDRQTRDSEVMIFITAHVDKE
jgi:type II secretory pathway component GspD/PulD (secretin)